MTIQQQLSKILKHTTESLAIGFKVENIHTTPAVAKADVWQETSPCYIIATVYLAFNILEILPSRDHLEPRQDLDNIVVYNLAEPTSLEQITAELTRLLTQSLQATQNDNIQ